MFLFSFCAHHNNGNDRAKFSDRLIPRQHKKYPTKNGAKQKITKNLTASAQWQNLNDYEMVQT